jgi:hypothetical protein
VQCIHWEWATARRLVIRPTAHFGGAAWGCSGEVVVGLKLLPLPGDFALHCMCPPNGIQGLGGVQQVV